MEWCPCSAHGERLWKAEQVPWIVASLHLQGASHIDSYDNEPFVATATEATLAWFAEHLA
jgi:fermentation-respiration switch protein FrsA (DUF1100 family)